MQSIEEVIAKTMTNAMIYPKHVAVHVLGTDMSEPINAVVTALKDAGYRNLPTESDTLPVGTEVCVIADIPHYRGRRGTVIMSTVDHPEFTTRVRLEDGLKVYFRPFELQVTKSSS